MNEENAGATNATTATPMIDFTKLFAIIPNNGTLNLVVIKGKEDKITVIYAPKFKGKEDDNVLRPIKMEDTPENLTATFELNITDISAKQRIYADDFKVRTEELDKAIQEKTVPAVKAKTVSGKTSSAKTTSKAQDLLTMPTNEAAKAKTEEGTEIEENDEQDESVEQGSDTTASATCEAAPPVEVKNPVEPVEDLFES